MIRRRYSYEFVVGETFVTAYQPGFSYAEATFHTHAQSEQHDLYLYDSASAAAI